MTISGRGYYASGRFCKDWCQRLVTTTCGQVTSFRRDLTCAGGSNGMTASGPVVFLLCYRIAMEIDE
jgi:hypothetical protein